MHSGFRLRAIALAGIGLFVAAACGPSSTGTTLASTQELRVNIGTEPCCFDPGQTQWNYEAAVDRQVFEAPLKASKDFKRAVLICLLVRFLEKRGILVELSNREAKIETGQFDGIV